MVMPWQRLSLPKRTPMPSPFRCQAVSFTIRSVRVTRPEWMFTAKLRLRAILLTTLTTVAGLTPLMFETSFQAKFLIPMAVTLTFGLIFATALTLVIVPTLNMIFFDLRSLIQRVRQNSQ